MKTYNDAISTTTGIEGRRVLFAPFIFIGAKGAFFR